MTAKNQMSLPYFVCRDNMDNCLSKKCKFSNNLAKTVYNLAKNWRFSFCMFVSFPTSHIRVNIGYEAKSLESFLFRLSVDSFCFPFPITFCKTNSLLRTFHDYDFI